MADIKLYDIKGQVRELPSKQVAIEKDLQRLLEENIRISNRVLQKRERKIEQRFIL